MKKLNEEENEINKIWQLKNEKGEIMGKYVLIENGTRQVLIFKSLRALREYAKRKKLTVVKAWGQDKTFYTM